MLIPPGLDGDLDEVSCGGISEAWLPLKPVKHFTNAFIWSEEEHKILLGFKKRGFGANLFNGFGGKVNLGETPQDAAKRELEEEAGISACLEECGTLLFLHEEATYSYYIHIFRANSWKDKPVETEEMRPQWFSTDPKSQDLEPIPFQSMWPDDMLWFPMLLDKVCFCGRVDFSRLSLDGSGGNMLKYWFGKYKQT